MTAPPQLVNFTRVKFDERGAPESFSDPDPITWAENMEHNARIESSGWRDLRRRLSFVPSAVGGATSSGGGVAKSAARKTRSFSLLHSARIGSVPLFRAGSRQESCVSSESGGEDAKPPDGIAEVVAAEEEASNQSADDDSKRPVATEAIEAAAEKLAVIVTTELADDAATSVVAPDTAPAVVAATEEASVMVVDCSTVGPDPPADTAKSLGSSNQPVVQPPKKRESITSGLRRFSLKEVLLSRDSATAVSPTAILPPAVATKEALNKSSSSSHSLLVPTSSRSSLSKSPIPSSKKSVGKTVSSSSGMPLSSSPKPRTPISKTLSSLTTTFSRRTSNSSSAAASPPPTNSFVLTQIVNLMLNTVMGKGFDFTGG